MSTDASLPSDRPPCAENHVVPIIAGPIVAGMPAAALSPSEQVDYAREIIHIESQALLTLAERLDDQFCRAASSLFHCHTNVIVTGMGKAGLVGQKIAATLASTGTRSHFLHPAEAFHGDLGRIHRDDVVLVLSQSGETNEVTQLLPSLSKLGVTTIAITGKKTSTLARAASTVLELGPLKEACSLGLAPSTSTTAMLSLGDALALVVSRMRRFSPEDFARFHPGGSLGQQLSHVEEQMRPLAECRVAAESETVREVLTQKRRSGRRIGAIMLTGSDSRLSGFFTDSDLARLFESHQNDALDKPIGNVMTRAPVTVPIGSMISDALAIMAERKISELPVVDEAGLPVGLLDITDLVAGGLESPTEEDATPAALPLIDEPANRVVPKPKLFSRRDASQNQNS